MPFFHEIDVAAVVVSASGNQDHAGPVGVGRFLIPFYIWHAMLVGVEPRCLGDIGHRCNLMRLEIRHFVDAGP